MRRAGQRFATGFTPGQKVLSVLAVAGLALGIVTFTKWAAATDYAPLYSDLDSRDAADITSELDSQGVGYKLANGGSTIMVPKNDVYQARLDLSAKGLPSSGDGYALLDDGNSITQSEFSQRVDYQRAVQTELSNTIMAMDGVRAATVNITLPSDDPFVGAEEPTAKAAVLLDLGNAGLAAEGTQAIVHLVSSSVADLSPDAVTVTDTAGNVLAAPGGDDALASSQNLAKTAAYETAMASKIEALLAKSLGPGHATVAVTAAMDFSTSTESTIENTPAVDDAGNPIPSVSEDETTRYTGPGNNTTGILGLDGQPIAGGSDQQIVFDETKSRAENFATSVERVVENPGGEVESVSIAVMVDEEKVTGGTTAITELVRAAAGIDTTAGDTVTVQAMPFDESVQEAVAAQLSGAKSTASTDQLMGIVRYAATLGIVGLVLLLAWRAVKRAQLSMGPLRVPLDLAQLEAAGYGTTLGELTALNEAMGALPEPPRQLEPLRSPVEQEITDLIDRQPDEVAQTLRSWLADRRA
jgi:flagellar M-ring protein FliF